jgi:MFS family permease
MDLRPLRRRDFRLLFVAQAVSFLGTMVTYVALPWQMYALTRSSLAVGILGVVELVPLLLTAFIGGALADWMDRRRLVIATEIGLMAGCLLLMANAALPAPSVTVLYVAAGLMSAFNGLQRPSLEAMTPRLVPVDEIPAVAALSMLRGSLGMILGPALGGVLVGSAGAVAAFGVDAVSYMASLVCFVAMRAVPPRDAAEAPTWQSIVEGFRYARSRQELIGTYVIDFVAMVFGMPLALFPALAAGHLGAGALGPLYAAPAVGALAASLTSRWTPRVHRHGLAVMIAATVWGVAIVAFGLAPSLWPALAWLALAGGADAVSGMFRMTMWNQTIPDALRGRLAGIELVSYMSGPLLGHAEAGAVAAIAGVQASIVSGGVLCVAGVVVCGLLLPRFRRYDARSAAVPAAAADETAR